MTYTIYYWFIEPLVFVKNLCQTSRNWLWQKAYYLDSDRNYLKVPKTSFFVVGELNIDDINVGE